MKKYIVFGIIVLFVGTSIAPSIIGLEEDQYHSSDDNVNILSGESNLFDNETEYWALLIYMGIYVGNPELNYPPEALEYFEKLHEKLLVSEHWKEENIKVITGRRAFLLNIINGFRWLDKREDENDISVVYINTHGSQLKRDKWPFDEWDGYDESLLTYLGGLFPWTNLRDDFLNLLLSFLDSKGTCVIIDSCHSGGFNDTPCSKNSMDDNKMNADEWMHGFAEDIRGSGRVVLMSCSEDELSYLSVFPHYLTEGLTGYADADKDDLVSAEEAFDYVLENFDNPDVHPTIYDDYPGELHLTVVEFPPLVPEIPTGQVLGDANTTYYYSTISTDPGGDNISYGWDWDSDYIVDEWTDFIGANVSVNISHSWSVEGTNNIRVKAKDEKGLLSDFSNHTVVIMCDDNIPDQQQILTNRGTKFADKWEAQSFVPSLDTLSKVELALYSSESTGTLPCYLYIRDNLSGENLAEVSQSIPSMGDWEKYNWFTFDFEDLDVIPGKTYYIVCKSPSAGFFIWRGEKDAYPLGKEYQSEDGINWHSAGLDLSFVTWGKIG